MNISNLLKLILVFSISLNALALEIKQPYYLYIGFARWFTLSQDIQPIGPILKDGNSAEYTQTIFRKIINTADKIAQEVYEEGKNDNYTYYSFLIAALTVPYHESTLNQFRERYGQHCTDIYNQLNHNKIPNVANSLLKDNYRNKYPIIFPDCRYFSFEEKVIQVMGSNDYSDYGIMQLNYLFHPHTVLPEYYLNVFKSIEYGLNYLYSARTPSPRRNGGFRYIRSQINKRYKNCDFSKSPFKNGKEKLYYSLIKSSWDVYNQGSHGPTSACRFDKNKTNAAVVEFKRALDNVIHKKDNPFQKYLPEDSLERKVYDEITHNFKAIYLGGKERNTSLNKLLEETNTQTSLAFEKPEAPRYAPSHITKEKRNTVYGPSINSIQTQCGTVQGGAKLEALTTRNNLQSIYNQKTKKNDLFIKVKVPHQDNIVELNNTQTYVHLKKKYKNKKKSRNVRSDHKKSAKLLFKWEDLNLTAKLISKIKNWAFLEFTNGEKGWIYLDRTQIKIKERRVAPHNDCLSKEDEFFINITSLENLAKIDYYTSGDLALGTVTATSLKVREVPSKRGVDTMKRLYLNQLIKVTASEITESPQGKEREWYKIETTDINPITGWVSAEYINLTMVLNK